MANAIDRAKTKELAASILESKRQALMSLASKHDIAPYRSALVDNLIHAQDINWRALAKRDPFKYIQCMEKLALMSGYVFDGMSNGPTVLVVEGMADNDLVRALAIARAKTSALPLTLDAHAAPSDDGIYKVYPDPAAAPSVPEATSVPAPLKQVPCQSLDLSPTSVSVERSTGAGVSGSDAE